MRFGRGHILDDEDG